MKMSVIILERLTFRVGHVADNCNPDDVISSQGFDVLREIDDSELEEIDDLEPDKKWLFKFSVL